MNAEPEKFVMPAVSMNEQPASYTFTFTVPGVGKKDADLHVEGRTLTLKTHATWQNPAGFRQVEAEFDRENYAASVDLPEMADVGEFGVRLLGVDAERQLEAARPRRLGLCGLALLVGHGGGLVGHHHGLRLQGEVHVLCGLARQLHVDQDRVVVQEHVHGRETARRACAHRPCDAVVHVEQRVQPVPGIHVYQCIHGFAPFKHFNA